MFLWSFLDFLLSSILFNISLVIHDFLPLVLSALRYTFLMPSTSFYILLIVCSVSSCSSISWFVQLDLLRLSFSFQLLSEVSYYIPWESSVVLFSSWFCHTHEWHVVWLDVGPSIGFNRCAASTHEQILNLVSFYLFWFILRWFPSIESSREELEKYVHTLDRYSLQTFSVGLPAHFFPLVLCCPTWWELLLAPSLALKSPISMRSSCLGIFSITVLIES